MREGLALASSGDTVACMKRYSIMAACMGLVLIIRPVMAEPRADDRRFPVLCTGFNAGEAVARIAFGSCAQQNRPQPIWHAIADAKPDVFIFLGDNIYGDSDDISKLRADYVKLSEKPGFVRLREQGACILATWDDHDYGKNDAGAEWKIKRESQQLFLDFVGAPADSPRRSREGIYDSMIIGPEGKRVQFILLDTRYFRSPLNERGPEPARELGRPGPYTANTDPSSTLLGDAQWAWLAEQLKQPAEVRIIATSIQFVAEEHHFELWGNFPHERARMLKLIDETDAAGVVFISGDRHHAEISRLDGGGVAGSAGTPYPIIDVTSSPINQTKRWGNELNRHRIGAMYSDPNFGLIEIDWSRADPVIALEVRAEDGAPLIRHEVALSELR